GRREVEEGGMKVVTTLDYSLQKIAEEEIIKGVEAKGSQFGFTNASLVAEDPKTGQILAMVGSKDFFDKTIDGQVNVSTRLRQPGSSFKPIIYTKAFEMGYTPNTVLWDVVTNFPTAVGTYTPHNYDLKEHGPIRVRNALQMSLNIPAVKMVYLVGVDAALDFATSLGYTSFSNHANFGLSLVLGGGEVRLIDHVNAYATLANEGKKFDQVSVLRVEDANGNILEEWKPKDGKQVVEQNTAKMITNVLSDNVARTPIFGPASTLHLADRPVAAKSGTTNNFHDAWLMGYSPSLVSGVWVGNNNNAAMKNKADGSVVAGPIWNAFMKRAHMGKPVELFNPPTIHPTGKSVLDGTVPMQSFVIDRASNKLATEFTPDSFKETRFFGGYHEILHYINPKEPLLNAPEHPEQDSNYTAWENGVADWVLRKQKETGVILSQTLPPTEQDDLHIATNIPSIQIISPQNNSALSGGTFSVSVNATSPRGILRVEYYLEGLYVGSASQAP
ncbi:MAG: penicillin-binding transpeptidase domain-containing protein, partial [Patescibacteria group bacterium]